VVSTTGDDCRHGLFLKVSVVLRQTMTNTAKGVDTSGGFKDKEMFRT
jgi:hypothetical protein